MSLLGTRGHPSPGVRLDMPMTARAISSPVRRSNFGDVREPRRQLGFANRRSVWKSHDCKLLKEAQVVSSRPVLD